MSGNSTRKKTKQKTSDVKTNNDPCTLNERIEGRHRTGRRPFQDEEFVRKVLSKSLNCIYIYDVRSGRNVFVNDRFAELTGYNLKDLNAMDKAQFFALFHPDDRQVLTGHIDKVIHTGEDSPEIECRIRSNDENWVWCLSRYSVFDCNDDGSVSRIMVTLLNITNRKTAEQQLELENLEVILLNRIMRVFIEESGDKLFDLVLDIVQVGLASSYGVFGYISSPDHLTCPSLSKMLDECEVADKCIHYPPEKWKGLWARALTEKQSFYNNEPSNVPPGHPAIRNNLAAPILFQGEVIGLLNLANKESDYTENDRMLLEAIAGRIAPLLYAWIQKKLCEDDLEIKIKERTAELQQTKERLNDVLETLPAYLILLTPDYHVPFANRFFRERFGESQGKRCYEYLFGRNEPCEICETYTVLKTLAPHRWEWTGPDGRIYDVYDFPFTDADGTPLILEMGIDITEQKQASQYARSLIEGSLDPLVTISPEGKITDVNEATLKVTGIPRDKLIGTDFSDYFTEPEKAREGYRQVFAKGAVTDYPLTIRHKDGRNTNVLYNASVYRNIQGNVLGVFAAARDITERKQIEAAIQAEKQRFFDVLEALPPMICLLTPDYHVAFANRSFRQRFGESGGRHCYDYCFGHSEPCDFCKAYRVLETGKPQHWEVEIPDGSVIEVHNFPFTDADGSSLILEMNIDVTEQKRAAKALKDLNKKLKQRGKELQKSHNELEEKVKQRTSELAASIERLQEIRKDLSHAQEVAQIGSWRLDLRRNILTWSDETYRIFGVPLGTPLTYETFLGIVHPEDRLLVDNQWSSCLRGESYDIEHRIIVNGEVKWMLEKAYLEINGADETIGAFGIAQDITKRKASEESIKASLSEKEVLLKEIHHRVKNNMQVISSLVALQADESQDEIIRSALQDVTHRVRSMAMVHEKLYQSTDLAQVDFAEYAKGLLDYLCRFYGRASSNISIKTDLEQMLIPVNEAVPCGLILNELISNALRHAFPDYQRGEVVVSLHSNRQGEAVLSVRDNGKGLPAGFDWQKARSLGLRLVQMLARQLHADLKVYIDKGSEFKLIFRRLGK